MSYIARDLAEKLANESKDLFDNHEILGEDFHKMLLAINNLIAYLNRNYLNDDRLEKEVTIMTKTLYDPEVERRGYEKGEKSGYEKGKLQGILQEKVEIILKMNSKGYSEAEISDITDVEVERVQEIIKKHIN